MGQPPRPEQRQAVLSARATETVPAVSAFAADLQTALSDRYLVERELGQGGMAIVYLASDMRKQRPVAVKVLRPERVAHPDARVIVVCNQGYSSSPPADSLRTLASR